MAIQCIPVEWTVINAADSFDTISTSNKKIKSSEYKDTGKYPVIDQGQKYISGYIDDNRNVIMVTNPLVVFGDHTKVMKFIDFNFVPGADGTKVLDPKKFIDPTFFYYQLRNLNIPDKGYSRHFKFFKELDFVLPSTAEQKKIVDRLDILLAQVEATQARLARIPDIIKQFRQSVLAAAVSGKLTEEWRNRLENIDDPMSIVQTEKRMWIEKNSSHNEINRVIKRVREYNWCKTITESELPASWSWQQLEDSVLMIVDCHNKTAPYVESGIPLIRTSNIRDGKFVWQDLKFVNQETYEYWSRRCQPEPGDIIFTREAPMGEAAIVPTDHCVCLGQRTMLIRPLENLISAKYLLLAIMEPNFKKRSDIFAVGTGVKHYRVGDVSNLIIPIPPTEEQTEIVHRVEQLFAYADSIEQQAKTAKERVDKLTQAILAKAFRGELTADWRAANPDLISGDNSAAALLARIQAERAAVKPRKRASKPAISPTSSGVPQ
ncbi:hypothetical protein RIMD111065_29700 [Aeromonas hydrophila]|nr:restriction endonuclease subunit S [Aeromonas hydrophila]BCO14614.1 hypothetical protein RIMD111065_29700 [Aeromonas hydrophila]